MNPYNKNSHGSCNILGSDTLEYYSILFSLWENPLRGKPKKRQAHKDKVLSEGASPKQREQYVVRGIRTGGKPQGLPSIPRRVFCNIPGSDTLEYYSILSSLGLAPLKALSL
jgi:hypothetical protein